MRTLIRDSNGNPCVTYDEKANICYYHMDGKELPMIWNEQTSTYEFEDRTIPDVEELQESINDGIFEVIHVQ